MKFSTCFLSALVAVSSVSNASPIDSFFRKVKSHDVAHLAEQSVAPNNTASNVTSHLWNTTNSSSLANSSSPSNSSTAQVPKLKVFITGGQLPLNLSKLPQDVECDILANSSAALNVTELYKVADAVNSTLSNETYKGVVIISNANSLEPLGFFSSIVLDSNKPVVVAQDLAYGLAVANNSHAGSRGPLVVTRQNLVYSGVFAPTVSPNNVDGSLAVPVASCSDDGVVAWFTSAIKPALIAQHSNLRTNFSSFTNTKNISYTPIVPIVYDTDYDLNLLDNVSSSLGGLVVATSSFTDTSLKQNDTSSITLPVVYASTGSAITYVSPKDVPANTCGAGYLSPLKAQLLLSIALVNNVTSPERVASIFH